MAVLPAELEDVPDDFFYQLEGLLDLRLNQRGEVNDSDVHLHTHTRTHNPNSRGLAHTLKLDCKKGAQGNERKSV